VKFAAIIEYTADRDRIAAVRPVHRQYLAQLKDQGKLVASGPFTDDSGALIIYEANDRQEAEQLLQRDPFCRQGVFRSWQLRPWNPVLANRELLPE